jgi:hypothetical protein
VKPYPRAPFGLRIDVLKEQAGGTFEIAVTLSNGSAVPWTPDRLTLGVPTGWGLRSLSSASAAYLKPGEALRSIWRLTRPANAEIGSLYATGSAATPNGPLLFTTRTEFRWPAAHSTPAPSSKHHLL